MVALFIEDFLDRYPDGKIDALIEFELSSLKCLTFTGPVKDEKYDPRSKFAYEEMDTTIVEERLVIDSLGLNKQQFANKC